MAKRILEHNCLRSRDCAERFRATLESEGYKLLGDYTNSQTPVLVECPSGHRSKLRPGNVSVGKRCRQCSAAKNAEKKKVKTWDSFLLKLSDGFSVVDPTPMRVCDKIEMKCPNGHTYLTTANRFKNGVRCKVCNKRCPKEAKKEFLAICTKEGYAPLAPYKGADQKIKVRCPEGHIIEVRPGGFKKGRRCHVCSHTNQEKARQQMEDLAIESGYCCVSEYRGAFELMELACPEGHSYSVTPTNFKAGNRCAMCYAKSSASKYVGDHLAVGRATNRTFQKSSLTYAEIKKVISTDIEGVYRLAKTSKGEQVDHIIPFSWFDHNDLNQIKLCWSPKNLRVINISDNYKKGSTLDKVSINLIAKSDYLRGAYLKASCKPFTAPLIQENGYTMSMFSQKRKHRAA